MFTPLASLTSGPISSGVWGILAVTGVIVLTAVILVLWVWMLSDILARKSLGTLAKIFWVTFILLTPLLGSLIYALRYSPKWNQPPK